MDGFSRVFLAKRKNVGNSKGSWDSELGRLLPDAEEGELTIIACISGLMAKVAWCDLDVHGDEVEHMKKSLGHWTELPQQDIDAIVAVALEHTRELAGVEAYRYTEFLSERFDRGKTVRIAEGPFRLGGVGRNRGGEGIGGDSHHFQGAFVGTQALSRRQGDGAGIFRELALKRLMR